MNIKKSHPLFINKITDVDITRQDIANMEPELFKIYESEIDNRLANNQIGDLRQENIPNPFGNFGRETFDEAGGLIGNNNYPEFNQNLTALASSPMQRQKKSSENSRENRSSGKSKSSSEKSSGSSSEGKWVTINGNHVLIKD